MAGRLVVGAGDGPHIVAAQRAAHVYLLAVDDVLITVPLGGHLGVCKVRSRFGFGEQLPGADFAPEDGRQEGLFLLVSPPYHDGGPAQPSSRVVVRRNRETVGVNFLFNHHSVIEGEAAAAVLFGGRGPQPALLTQLTPQASAQLVLLFRYVDRVRWMSDIGRYVLREPHTYFLPEVFLFRGVGRFEVHGLPPIERAISFQRSATSHQPPATSQVWIMPETDRGNKPIPQPYQS